MKNNPVFKETAVILVGEIVGVALMLGVFAILGKLSPGVIWGGILGGTLAVLNFFFMGVGASLAADRAEADNVSGGKSLLAISRVLRFVVLFGVLILAGITKIFDPIALVVPFFFQTPILLLGEFFRKAGGKS